jgi:hypothetical protein
LTVGGSILGGSGEQSGSILSVGAAKAVVVEGDIIGGDGDFSGLIASEETIASARVEGNVIGGGGTQSGAIGSARPLGAVVIDGDLEGGDGLQSGVVVSAATIKSVMVRGAVIGGAGDESGAVGSIGGLGPVTIGKGIEGGAGVRSGTILSDQAVRSVVVAESIVGGSGNDSGGIFSNRSIGRVVVGLDLNGGGFSEDAPGDNAGSINSSGTIGKVRIGRDMIGSDGFNSGTIQASDSVGEVEVGGSLRGSLGSFSGAIVAGGKLGKAVIRVDMIGGVGFGSGSIETQGELSGGDIREVLVEGELRGGEGAFSGQIFSSGKLGKVTVGSMVGGLGFKSGSITSALDIDSAAVNGDMKGGSADFTGAITSFGGIGSLTVNGSVEGDFGRYVSGRSVQFDGGPLLGKGGNGDEDGGAEGQIFAAERIGMLRIAGDLRGGAGEASGQIRADGIRSVRIDGDVVGDGPGTGSIIAQDGDLERVIIGGRFEPGTSFDASRISASGRIESLSAGSLAGSSEGRGYITAGSEIGKVTVLDSVAYFNILAGYDVELGASSGLAEIGTVQVGTTGSGNWIATSVAAGVIGGNNGFFGGEGPDFPIGSPSPDGTLESKIASIVIKGAVSSTVDENDSYGIAAGRIVAVKVGGASLPLTSGLDDIVVRGGDGQPTDLRVREVAPLSLNGV